MAGDRIVIERASNPFEKLARILGDLAFDRSLREKAGHEALRAVKERWAGRHVGCTT